jgi:superfamily II DNA or RNA helicase
VAAYNRNEVDVLFVSKAGGEGLDLKGTRQIVLMESGWNENTEAQVIGRGVRFQSHAHLPPEERNVVIFRLHHIKQGEDVEMILSPEFRYDYNDPTTWPSADLLLKKISTRKSAATRAFVEKLKTLSVERNEECR